VEQDHSPLVEAAVLAAIDQLPYPMGRTGVARALQGAGSSPVKADRFPLFGALDGWTQVAIQDLIGQMEEAGLLAAYEKGRYRLLRLTEEGHARLKAQPEVSGTLPPLAPPPPTRPPGRRAQEIPGIPPPAETPGEIDQALFERLRAWRWATASAMDKPPYVVFPDSTLKLIASRRPANLEELAAIKGVGPSRLEQYGQHVLAILSGRE
jgi:ATP-dependent DNA helicase RecQ